MNRLPDFIIGGAPKCGTTTLYYLMQQHPDIYMPNIKEPRFFAYEPGNPEHNSGTGLRYSIKTLDDYFALFGDAAADAQAGEASPFYLYSATALSNIKRLIPDVKLIFSLRDPVSRAYSAYWHKVRMGKETRPIQRALTLTDEYVSNGRYFEKLEPWYDHFSTEQIRVILLDDLSKRTASTIRYMYRYVGVDESFVPEFAIRNQGGVYRNRFLGLALERIKTHPLRKAVMPQLPESIHRMMAGMRQGNFEAPPPIPAELELELRTFYRDDVMQLEKLLQRDLSAWYETEAVAARIDDRDE